jgi:hypothetical protein
MKKVKIVIFTFVISLALSACGDSSELASYAKEQITAFGNNDQCDKVEDLKLADVKIGTITQTPQTGVFKKPIPAIVARGDYVCLNKDRGLRTHYTDIWVVLALDSEFGKVRCLRVTDEGNAKRIAAECGFVSN